MPIHTVQAVTPDEVSGKRGWAGPGSSWTPGHRRREAIPRPVRRRRGLHLQGQKGPNAYELYRKRGLPVGSGLAESVCKYIVGNRFKGAGHHWSSGRQRLARHQMLPRKQAPAQLPRTEGLSRHSRMTKENGPHPTRTRVEKQIHMIYESHRSFWRVVCLTSALLI